jgi:hypothetical protein
VARSPSRRSGAGDLPATPSDAKLWRLGRDFVDVDRGALIDALRFDAA